jgi:hypothetical protein
MAPNAEPGERRLSPDDPLWIAARKVAHDADPVARPDAELYDGSSVHQESYRRGYRNGYEDGVAAAKAQIDELVSSYQASPNDRSGT